MAAEEAFGKVSCSARRCSNHLPIALRLPAIIIRVSAWEANDLSAQSCKSFLRKKVSLQT